MLEIDEALRRGDHVEIELLDLADFLAAVIFGARARDGDVDALEIGLQVARPILALARQIAERLFRRALPAFVAERSEEHTSELQSLMRISYAVFCLTKNTRKA